MKTRKLYAIAPDETLVSRRTHREYAFAVLARGDGDDPWGAWSFHETHAAAVRGAGSARVHYGHRVVIAPVTDRPHTVIRVEGEIVEIHDHLTGIRSYFEKEKKS